MREAEVRSGIWEDERELAGIAGEDRLIFGKRRLQPTACLD